ncbi:MAG TPA: class I SAM-dependent methyltransferase [Candidatus Methylomirabilis sp.]|nr:class I SAM-dependent methyltransferase [Candidatus Methylomirabilis sp.]
MILRRVVKRARRLCGRRAPRDPEIARYLELKRAFDRTEGWCSEVSLAVWDSMLAHQRERGVRGDLLEIGVYRGKSALLLAAHLDPSTERLFLVDPTMDQDGVRRTLEGSRAAAGPALRFLPIDSAEVLSSEARSARRRLRWIHIDGGHSVHCLLADLASAHELLADDGVAVIDDFFNVGYPHLTETTFRYLANQPERLALFLAGGNKGYLARPQVAPHYRHYCLQSLIGDLEARGVEMALWKTGLPGEIDCFAIQPREFSGQRLRGIDGDQSTIHSDARPDGPLTTDR